MMPRLVILLTTSFLLVACGGSGSNQNGTTVIDQPKQEANCNG